MSVISNICCNFSFREQNMKFSEILSQLESSPVCQSLSLHSFLMLPMQRITRLPLLVDAVLTRLDPQDDEYNTCRLALATLNKVSLLKVILPCILDLMFCTVTYKSSELVYVRSHGCIAFVSKTVTKVQFILHLMLGKHYIELGSSVSIVSGYGLDERAIKVRSQAVAKDFCSSLCVQTVSGAHLTPFRMCTGGPFPGAKARLEQRQLTSQPHLVLRSRMSRSSISSPPKRLCGM
jgi:hypothetical protein